MKKNITDVHSIYNLVILKGHVVVGASTADKFLLSVGSIISTLTGNFKIFFKILERYGANKEMKRVIR